jgi:anthranilate phosphoribosyltransferase
VSELEAPSFAEILAEVERAEGISTESVERVFQAMFQGAWSAEKVAGLLVALRVRGESSRVIESAAKVMRRVMLPVPHPFERLLDTCGTGGDGLGTVNLSTGAAIIASAAGAVVAKHGNRAASSRCGTADVLAALGLPLDLTPEAAGKVLADAKITFLMATVHHPAMRFVGPVRRELGVRTIFNCLGPLANPAGATHQLLGAYEDRLRPLLAEALRELGSKRAWVVRGAEGLDEVSPLGVTRVTELAHGRIAELEVSPEDFGCKRLTLADIAGSDAQGNAEILLSVLRGERVPSRDAFILNAAAALVVFDGDGLREAAQRARAAIDSGAALRTLEHWRARAQAQASAS